jgi:hypothetical protein
LPDSLTAAGGPQQIRPRLQHQLCLTTGNNTSQGAVVSLQPCHHHHPSNNDQWILKQDDDGTIRPVQDPTKCLDAGTAGWGSSRSRQHLRIYTCVANRQSQRWLLDRAMNLLKPMSASWMCLDSAGDAAEAGLPASSTGNGANIRPVLSSCSSLSSLDQFPGSPSHQWLWVAARAA